MDFLAEQSAFINAPVSSWVLGLVMLGMGLSLILPNIKCVITFPKATAVFPATAMIFIRIARRLIKSEVAEEL